MSGRASDVRIEFEDETEYIGGSFSYLTHDGRKSSGSMDSDESSLIACYTTLKAGDDKYGKNGQKLLLQLDKSTNSCSPRRRSKLLRLKIPRMKSKARKDKKKSSGIHRPFPILIESNTSLTCPTASASACASSQDSLLKMKSQDSLLKKPIPLTYSGLIKCIETNDSNSSPRDKIEGRDGKNSKVVPDEIREDITRNIEIYSSHPSTFLNQPQSSEKIEENIKRQNGQKSKFAGDGNRIEFTENIKESPEILSEDKELLWSGPFSKMSSKDGDSNDENESLNETRSSELEKFNKESITITNTVNGGFDHSEQNSGEIGSGILSFLRSLNLIEKIETEQGLSNKSNLPTTKSNIDEPQHGERRNSEQNVNEAKCREKLDLNLRNPIVECYSSDAEKSSTYTEESYSNSDNLRFLGFVPMSTEESNQAAEGNSRRSSPNHISRSRGFIIKKEELSLKEESSRSFDDEETMFFEDSNSSLDDDTTSASINTYETNVSSLYTQETNLTGCTQESNFEYSHDKLEQGSFFEKMYHRRRINEAIYGKIQENPKLVIPKITPPKENKLISWNEEVQGTSSSNRSEQKSRTSSGPLRSALRPSRSSRPIFQEEKERIKDETQRDDKALKISSTEK